MSGRHDIIERNVISTTISAGTPPAAPSTSPARPSPRGKRRASQNQSQHARPADGRIHLETLPLQRYNGRSHEHTNLIERDRFSGFHVHTATERDQQLGADEDAYAEPTDRYADLHGALQCMFEDCGFAAEGGQLGLFPGYVP